ncbi:MAG: hypothetical protein KGK07_06280 [Chloroflexota bacterium]|nr:hypothetical protein [Chloroflexota bacterium]
MALNPKRSNAAANAACDAMAALCNGGYLRIYDDAQPANADTPVGGQTLLAELTFANPAFAAAVAGVATANAIGSDLVANATGVAAWFRVFKADGISAVYDGSVGVANADLVVNSANFQQGARIDVTALTLTELKG